ncbi:hypothetical protein D6829_00705 [Candidatus Pacearchaeota archaeon]|nr:MAG: hypothetical protein D6829_00705 [Candidatus Pacearchaeota archaeon]
MGIILVDMDGVIADYVGGIERELSHAGIDPIPRSMMTRYDFSVYSKEAQEFIEEIPQRRGFFYSLKPVEGALEGVIELSTQDEVFICSAPKISSRYCHSEKSEWIKNHLGKEFCKRLILAKDKTLVMGDILLDDRPDVFGIAVPKWKQVLFRQPWNSHIQEMPSFSWSEGIKRFYDIVRTLWD